MPFSLANSDQKAKDDLEQEDLDRETGTQAVGGSSSSNWNRVTGLVAPSGQQLQLQEEAATARLKGRGRTTTKMLATAATLRLPLPLTETIATREWLREGRGSIILFGKRSL